MSIIAIAVNIGTPNSAGLFPVSTTSVASGIGQAQTDLSTLATEIASAATAAATADTDVGTVVTDLATAVSDMTTLLANADAAMGTNLASTALAQLFGLGYSSHQITGTVGGGGVTISQANANALVTLINTMLTSILTTQTALTTAQTANTTAKTAADAANTAVAALSTATVAADLSAATAGISGANLYIQTDSTQITNISELSSAFVSALTFARDDAILPT